MGLKTTIIVFILTYLFIGVICQSQLIPNQITNTHTNTIVNINKGWQLQIINCPQDKLIGQKFNVNLPTTLHLDLLKNGKIQDPFYRDNYRNLQWISGCQIKYTKKFKIQTQLLDKAIQLVFYGIDTYSKIKFNGQEILNTNNSFRTYTHRVKNINKQSEQENILQIYIEPVQKYDNLGQQKNNMPFKYAHTRKACYQYSWDWAPELVTMGIWRDVQIKFFDEVRFDYVWVRNKIISPQKAVINFAIKLLKDYSQTQLRNYLIVIKQKQGKQLRRARVNQPIIYTDVSIMQPKFWWPNGIGQPYVYDFIIQLIDQQTQKVKDSYSVIYGIRTVQLDLTNKQFKVKINGRAVYCKGANYVPLDMFHPRITNPDFQTQKSYTIQKLFDDAVASNFNMIRLWGGGQYQTNKFLQLASRKGIMIFYDFMFSDSIYPSTRQFLENVQQQIKQQIRRTRNYPALALWSGNNQILQGVQDWGWSSQKYTKDYKLLFEKLIKRIVQIQNPDISYIPSSPVYGVGNYGFQRGGDFHFWSVWAGGAAFQSYETAVGPFNSQFGTQALPVWQSIIQFTKPEDRSYQSPILLTHERHSSQFSTLRNYMGMYVNASKDFQSQVYLSGIVQAMGIQIAIKAQRTSKPKSYGTLYWQFNDAWPAISWAAIDYYGRWKPLQFMAKRTFPNIAVFTKNDGSVIAINDNLYPVDVVIKVNLVHTNGQSLINQEINKNLLPDSVDKIFEINKNQFSRKLASIVAYTQIYYKDQLQMRSTHFFKKIKQLELQSAKVICQQGQSSKILIFSSDKLVKNIFINAPKVKLSDNYFDIVPGHPVVVQILSKHKYEYIKSEARFISVRQASKNQNLSVQFK